MFQTTNQSSKPVHSKITVILSCFYINMNHISYIPIINVMVSYYILTILSSK